MRVCVHRGIICGLAALLLLTVVASQSGRWLLADDASPIVARQDRDFWSFRRVTRPSVPSVRNVDRPRTSIDRFLLERLEAKQLSFSPDADRRTLIRRVCLDLTGVPPSTAEVRHFLADDSPDAYERLVDRLLASPHFGERWARHWLDAAGYVDTVGFDVDADLIITSEGKWRYRDYVIGSFNDDKPYDRFLEEQLAGDELVEWRNATTFTPQIREALVATGFLRTAQDFTHEDVGNIPQNYYGVLHDSIEIIGSSLLGLTLNCARCHNHKFDPIPQEDYYRLMAVLTPAYNPQDWKVVFPYDQKVNDRALADVSPRERADIDRHNADLDRRVAELNRRLDELRRPFRERLVEQKLLKVPDADRADLRAAILVSNDKRNETQKRLAAKYDAALRVSPEEIAAALNDEQTRTVAGFSDEIAHLNKSRRSYGKIQALYDVGQPPITRQLVGGSFETPGSEAQPGILQVLCEESSSSTLASESRYPGTSGRRLALAHWLTAPNSRAAGLTARVMVNRIWQHLFGAGIVPTPENLGMGGEPPTHPELLEWLSDEFSDNGWRIKPLIRLAVLSTAYRQSANAAPPDSAASDADNALLSRMPLKRLESEVIRDSVLAISDAIDCRLGGPPIMLEFRPENGMIVVSEKQLPYPTAGNRRSIYLLARRAFQLSDLSVFDQPVVATNCPQRSRSAVPLQSLSMLNGPFVWEQSERFAERLPRFPGSSREQQISDAFEMAFARLPSSEELAQSIAFVNRQADLYRASSPAVTAKSPERKAIVHLCHTLLNTSEFLYVP